MQGSRYLVCLTADFDRLRAIAESEPTAAVPTCPGWTVADLTHHVGEVYLHKTLCMREGAEPDPWPPAGLADEAPLALLDRAYEALRAEFAARKPEDAAGGWYTPDRTVGFWIRRMAQETVIHRIDAELGAGGSVSPVPDDLAIDGIDELLKVFVAFSVAEWGPYFADALGSSPGRTFALRAQGTSWQVRTGPALFEVTDGTGAPADVSISGPPAALLRWVWNREDAEASGVTIDGPVDAVAELKRCIQVATQ
jgi:uncharacterized protein (TIGR03083 family)